MINIETEITPHYVEGSLMELKDVIPETEKEAEAKKVILKMVDTLAILLD